MSYERKCRKTGELFTVGDDDLRFLERMAPVFSGATFAIPPPTLHPSMRAMRRMVWRNSNHLYRRTCGKTATTIISGFPQAAPYPVFATGVWWGDGWDQYESGREFDFRRPFFEQFRELQFRAPRPALMNRDPENSEYCNYAGENKQCYMANNGSWYNEGCLLGEAYLRSRDSVDCSYLRTSELCYEVVGGEGLYDCAFVTDCYHSSSCYFSFNLRSCSNCFLCCNLRNAEGFLLNRPASKAEIAAAREKMKTRSGLEDLLAELSRLNLESLHPDAILTNCEESDGELLSNCKNVLQSFICGTIRDGKYLFHCDEGQDMWDCSLAGYEGSELYYEAVSSGCGGSRVLFSSGSWGSSDVLYCDTVMTCQSCFGCVGLKRAENCILNQTYSRAEYERLVPKIIGHMRETGEWGEFFPEEIGPHGYNESHAMDWFPLTRAQAESYGYSWRDDAQAEPGGSKEQAPESINECSSSTAGKTFSCAVTGKPYRIVPQELAFLLRLGIAPPGTAPDVRRRKRNARRNPLRLWPRRCCIDARPILTTYAPDRPERVCCGECFVASIYGADC